MTLNLAPFMIAANLRGLTPIQGDATSDRWVEEAFLLECVGFKVGSLRV